MKAANAPAVPCCSPASCRSRALLCQHLLLTLHTFQCHWEKHTESRRVKTFLSPSQETPVQDKEHPSFTTTFQQPNSKPKSLPMPGEKAKVLCKVMCGQTDTWSQTQRRTAQPGTVPPGQSSIGPCREHPKARQLCECRLHPAPQYSLKRSAHFPAFEVNPLIKIFHLRKQCCSFLYANLTGYVFSKIG